MFEDPLADLLSDNSIENENFFDSQTRVNRNVKKPINKGIDDLFGIKDELTYSSKLMVPKVIADNPLQTHIEENEDLGFDPKKPKASSKVNILDELLSADIKRPSTATTRTPLSRQSTDTTENSNFRQTQARPKTSGGRQTVGTVGNSTSLSFFSGEQREKEFSVTKKRGTTADWLGLNTDDEEITNKRIESTESQLELPILRKDETVQFSKQEDTIVHESPLHHNSNFNVKQSAKTDELNVDSSAINVLQSVHLEAKKSFNALQQQETQLAVATQIKNQEVALIEMQRKQDALLQQQQRQFQLLLNQQVERQQQMEEHIRLQQNRINAHIQLMMTLPGQEATIMNEQFGKDVSSKLPANSANDETTQLDAVQLESEIKRLGLEKLRLEELVEVIRTNSDRELELTESSYKKQIQVLEQHLAVIETRFKNDAEQQDTYYKNKLEHLEEEKLNLKTEYENTITMLKKEHDDTIQKLRKLHQEDIDLLKDEHRRMVETIREAKMLEFSTIQESGNYLETLKVASDKLDTVSGGLLGLRDDIHSKIELVQLEKEKKLELREKKLEDAERHLKINEDAAQEDKRRLLDLVATLELQLGKLSKESAEENWQLRQKIASIDAEKTAFEREKEYFREQLLRDEKRIDDLKDQQIAEAQKFLLELQEERERLQVERTKFETEKKLHLPTDYQKQRLEIDASLEVASDAIKQAELERERFHKMQKQLDQQRREFMQKETALREREEQVEQEISTYCLAEKKSQEAIQKAQFTEQAYQKRLQELQQRLVDISEKEAQLSQDRVMLSQERIALQSIKQKIIDYNCPLCKINEQTNDINKFSSLPVKNCNTNNQEPLISAVLSADAADLNNFSTVFTQNNIVDRLLDENIANSMFKMRNLKSSNLEFWTQPTLDDDLKKLSLKKADINSQNDKT